MGRKVFLCVLAASGLAGSLWPQTTSVAGINVNMVSGTTFPDGDPYLQRQNEPSLAVSTRNPQHLFAGANDYRTVDIPFPPDDDRVVGDAWLGLFKSTDGGATWRSTLMPGYPQDTTPAGLNSPLHGFQVATDPTVRAGTHGLFYYSGLVFNRGTKGSSGAFIATFQDNNNEEKGDPFAYVGAKLVDSGTSGQFLDKPWIAVDIPRPGTTVGAAACTIGGKSFTSGNVYAVYSEFLGTPSTTNPHTQITLVKSTDCGQTWSKPQKVSESYQLNQGTVAAVDPGTGALYIVWRQIATSSTPDGINYVVSTDGGKTFSKGSLLYTFAPGTAFDQGASYSAFRTMALPTLAVDGSGRVYVAFSQRGLGPYGEARVLMTTLARGSTTWTKPYLADSSASALTPGHQFLPSLAFAYGKLMLAFYDTRDDNTKGVLACQNSSGCKGVQDFVEVRQPVGDRLAGNLSKVFTTTVSDAGLTVRHTLDVRGAIANPAAFNTTTNTLDFLTSRISQYPFGSRPGQRLIEQMKFNPPNFPLFAKGTKAFVGDYIDVGALGMVLDGNGNWVFNTQPASSAVFYPVWTDNRDVRPPPLVCTGTPQTCTQDWTKYTPAGSTTSTTTSLYDPTQQRPACVPGQAGTRNQNIYTSRVTEGLLVFLRQNVKSMLSSTNGAQPPRIFAVLVQNNRNKTAYYRLTINTPLPAGTTASFSLIQPKLSLDVAVPPRSTVTRNIFVTSSAARPVVTVSVQEIDPLNGTIIAGGLQSSATINADITNPDITNPDITNPDITNPDITNPDITNPDITAAEIYTPTVTNPDITNPDIASPQVTNPDITNPDITNPDITNPDITNPDITNPTVVTNPDITNPDITNPDITNPDITNPDITNPDIASIPAGGATDFTWKLTNKGNTSVSYNVRLLQQKSSLCCPAGCPGGANCPASCYKCQLILRKTYPTPVANGCTLTVETQNITNSNIGNPVYTDPGSLGTSDNSGAAENSTVSMSPGEAGRVTVRVFGLTTNAPPAGGLGQLVGLVSGAPQYASLAITTTQLPPAFIGVSYTQTLQYIGATGSVTWSTFGSGSLPGGLGLNPATGQISGTPLSPAGSSSFTVQATDSAGHIARQSLTIDVSGIVINSVTASPVTAKGGSTVTVAVSISNTGTAGPATVTPSALTVTVPAGSTAGASCVTPASALIPAGGSQPFAYSCTVSGDGQLSFTASASGSYTAFTPAIAVSAAAVTSNSIRVDSTPPALTLPASITAEATGPTGAVVTYTASATDLVDGPVPISCAPASGGTFPLGTTTVTCTASDKVGNTAIGTFTVTVRDTIAPTITASATTADGKPYLVNTWTKQTVTVAFACTDGGSGVLTSSVTAPVTLAAEGAGQSASGSCSDKAGNSATVSFGPVNIDKTAPTVTITSPANGATYPVNSSITAAYTCGDALSGLASCAGTAPSGAAFTVTSLGAGVFSVTATDKAGNSATAIVNYSVSYQFTGFLSPLSTAGTVTAPSDSGSVKYGQGVPLKWQIQDGTGAYIANDLTTTVSLQAVSCPGETALPANLILYSSTSGTTGGSTFRYDLTNNQYMFNWDTSYAPGTGCYDLVLQLKDGSSYATKIHVQ